MDENKIEKLLRIIAELRDPISGCEWTKSQTSKTLLPFIIEEAKEVLDAFEKEDNENFKELFAWYAQGKLKPFTSKTYTLNQATLALNDLKNRKAIGKLIIQISS